MNDTREAVAPRNTCGHHVFIPTHDRSGFLCRCGQTYRSAHAHQLASATQILDDLFEWVPPCT